MTNKLAMWLMINLDKIVIKRPIIYLLPDKLYLKVRYWANTGKKLNFENPRTFNEKLQWLKIYDKNPMYVDLVDKYEVRKHISETLGEDYLIPLLGVYDSFDEIDFDKLPNQFVLKCTHDSGGVVICKNKNTLDMNYARNTLNRCLKNNFYWNYREWPYKNIKPRIICEKYMVDESGTQLKDYKFFCFNGTPRLMFVASDRGSETKFDFFDMDYNIVPVQQHYPNSSNKPKRPETFEKMKKLASKLSEDFHHVRIDFYEVNGNIYFGEYTLYHFAGVEKFNPQEFDQTLGDWLKLPSKNNSNYKIIRK